MPRQDGDGEQEQRRSRQTRNLASALKRVKVSPAGMTDEDLQLLAMELILDQDDMDIGVDAQRAKVSLEALKFIHEVRKDGRPKDGVVAESDFEVWKVKHKG